MAMTTQQVNRVSVREPRVDEPLPAQAPKCPRCDGTGWVKVFTPWGCPTSTACGCQQNAVRSDEKSA